MIISLPWCSCQLPGAGYRENSRNKAFLAIWASAGNQLPDPEIQ